MVKDGKMNVLGIGAHFDDIELGCSGTLINHVEKGDNVTICVITDSSYSSPTKGVIREKEEAEKEGEKACSIIGAELLKLNFETFHVYFNEELTASLLKIIENKEINTIYAPWINDVHRDHSNAGRAALMAGRHVPRFLMYPINWYNSNKEFKGSMFSDISHVFTKKIEVIKAHESEIRRTGSKWLDYVKSRNRLDGLKAGVDYAESFELVRYLF